MKIFELTVVTPERITFQGKISSLILPAWEGSMGILPGHTPALVLIKEGVIRTQNEEGIEETMSVSGGFVEIGQRKATLFAETAELAQEIDEERARLALARAKEDVAKTRAPKKGPQEIDVEKAQAALRRALTRLKAVENARRIRGHRTPPPVNEN
ncbi:MAG: ATP synthase F1 subunit epsilon [Elusimicrobia bacterium]|nr:ATP synthase F1 subunit epsilon [Elusimicrobiota bacterium]